MKLHYQGQYNMDEESIPHNEHKPGAVCYREVDGTGKLALVANLIAIGILVLLLGIPYALNFKHYFIDALPWSALGGIASLFTLFPHELLHAVCFKGDVYLYTNLKQGMLFVTGPEDMSKMRFIFLSMLPNLVFGFIPYLVGLFLYNGFLLFFGALCVSMGAGDYYNVVNTLFQVPAHARVYMYGTHTWWYRP